MRNFKKVMALAISTAAIATSVSAFAAEMEYSVTGLNGSYDATSNALTLTVDGASGDKTVLVLDNGVEDTAATGEDILYINQYTASETAFSAMGLKGETALAAGTYAVKIGYTDANGDFAIANGAIVVAEKADELIEVTFYLGDVDSDNVANEVDAGYLLAMVTGGSPKVGSSELSMGDKIVGDFYLGDVDNDGVANEVDAGYLLAMVTGGSPKVGSSEYAMGDKVVVQVPVE